MQRNDILLSGYKKQVQKKTIELVELESQCQFWFNKTMNQFNKKLQIAVEAHKTDDGKGFKHMEKVGNVTELLIAIRETLLGM